MAPGPEGPSREVPALHLVPNLMTLGAICAGLSAIRFAVRGEVAVSVALIVIAAALDGLDGRLARLLRSESPIGAELDSLADFLNFGVVPALVLWLWGMQSTQSIGWIAVLVFAVACVLRLARFNVAARAPAQDADRSFFTGIPAPAGGLLAMLPIYVQHLAPSLPRWPEPAIAGWMGLVAVLMVSRIPTWSFKAMVIRPEHARPVLLAFVALAAALATFPWAVLVAASVLYLGSIPLSWRVRRRQMAEPDDAD